MPGRRRTAAAVAIVVSAVGVTTLPGQATTTAAAIPLTPVTDDPVVLHTAAGHEHVSRRTMTIDGHRYAIPGDTGQRRPRAVTATDVELTFEFRDRSGARTADAGALLLGADWVFEPVSAGPDGTATVRVPRGHYIVDSRVNTARPGKDAPSKSWVVNPDLDVTRDARVVVDAAVAKPVSVTVPDPRAVALATVASYRISLPGGGFVTADVGEKDMTALYLGHSGPAVLDDELDAAVTTFFARPGPAGSLVDSPVSYAASWQRQGRFYTGLSKRVSAAELSTVRAEHAATVPGRRAAKAIIAEPFSTNHVGFELEYTAAPFTRVEHYAGTAKWANVLQEYVPGDTPDPRDRTGVASQTQTPSTYLPGRQYHERWNLAPAWPSPRSGRLGDTIGVTPALYNDNSGRRTGTSAYTRAHVALFRGDDLIGESGRLDRSEYPVPAVPSAYRLTVDAERDLTDLASKVSASWTFTSAHEDGDESRPLGLMSVRFVPAGRSVPLAVHVERPVPGPPVRSLTLHASYDDGATWIPVRLTGTGGTRLARMRHPDGPGTVSLRATATDAHGDAVEQTILNAYRLS